MFTFKSVYLQHRSTLSCMVLAVQTTNSPYQSAVPTLVASSKPLYVSNHKSASFQHTTQISTSTTWLRQRLTLWQSSLWTLDCDTPRKYSFSCKYTDTHIADLAWNSSISSWGQTSSSSAFTRTFSVSVCHTSRRCSSLEVSRGLSINLRLCQTMNLKSLVFLSNGSIHLSLHFLHQASLSRAVIRSGTVWSFMLWPERYV